MLLNDATTLPSPPLSPVEGANVAGGTATHGRPTHSYRSLVSLSTTSGSMRSFSPPASDPAEPALGAQHETGRMELIISGIPSSSSDATTDFFTNSDTLFSSYFGSSMDLTVATEHKPTARENPSEPGLPNAAAAGPEKEAAAPQIPPKAASRVRLSADRLSALYSPSTSVLRRTLSHGSLHSRKHGHSSGLSTTKSSVDLTLPSTPVRQKSPAPPPPEHALATPNDSRTDNLELDHVVQAFIAEDLALLDSPGLDLNSDLGLPKTDTTSKPAVPALETPESTPTSAVSRPQKRGAQLSSLSGTSSMDPRRVSMLSSNARASTSTHTNTHTNPNSMLFSTPVRDGGEAQSICSSVYDDDDCDVTADSQYDGSGGGLYLGGSLSAVSSFAAGPNRLEPSTATAGLGLGLALDDDVFGLDRPVLDHTSLLAGMYTEPEKTQPTPAANESTHASASSSTTELTKKPSGITTKLKMFGRRRNNTGTGVKSSASATMITNDTFVAGSSYH